MVPPWCQGVRALEVATLSPSRALTGKKRSSSKPSGAAKARSSPQRRWKTPSSNPTRSILFTATASWRMPSSEAMDGVAAGLRQDAEPRVEQDDGGVGGGGAGGHVARVLHVPGRVGEDELAPLGREVAVGHVDGDSLLALRLEPVGEEREVAPRRRCAWRAAPGDLVVVERARLVEQAADERGLAVVHRADDHQPHQLLARRGARAARRVSRSAASIRSTPRASCFPSSLPRRDR